MLTAPSFSNAAPLRAVADEKGSTITVFRDGGAEPILTQNTKSDFRPYIHPIVAPDGKGMLTQYSPGHHKHQTGLFWGFTRVNGRDYFHHPERDYWKRRDAKVLEAAGEVVRWQTIYDLLDENGAAVLTETQTWTMRDEGHRYLLDLEWQGEAQTDITIGKYDYGGLFLRMPWKEGMKASAANAAREVNSRAEGRRAMWFDVGMQVDGRDDTGHIAIFDHPENKGFPHPWRVDGQFGVGPVRARLGDWKIAKGETETIRHRLVAYTGGLDDTALTEDWKRFSGQGGTWSLWGIAQQEGRRAEFLTPEKANEPMITQPMAFCWDDRGRMWIAENRDYEDRGKGFSNFGDSRILILEDTDHDGVADSRKVFLEGIPFPAGIAVGMDGLWLGAPPNLLFVPDRNNDDKADMEDIEVRLTGWGIRDRHETLNSFHWGPDGWLYGLQGYATPSKVGKPAGKGRIFRHKDPFPDKIELADDGVDINGGVWRYHPTKERFEVVAHGFSNPWGIDYDSKGQLFISACVIPHLWHVVQGGIFHRQGGKHYNPYAYSDIRTIVDHRHRSAHGGLRIYQSDAFPDSQQGKMFMANIHEHAVLTDYVTPAGSGFVASHGDEFLLANNAQWIGFSVEVGPEGAVYVLDWHDGDICGMDTLNKDTGRVFRITPEKSLATDWDGRFADIAAMSDAKLVDLQTSKSNWHARRARTVLQNRASKNQLAADTHAALREMFWTSSSGDHRLRAMWALHVTAGLNDGDLLVSLNDDDPHVRAWAVQFLCEDMNPSSVAIEKFEAMARSEASPVVRLYLASALQRMSPAARWSIAEGLVAHAQDADDHNIPHMIWFGIEPVVPQDPIRALQLASVCEIPMISQYIARRLVDADALEPLVAALGRLSQAQEGLLRGMRDGLEGRSETKAPDNWDAIYDRLQGANNSGRMALELAQKFGDTSAAESMLKTLDDKGAKLNQRQQALRQLASQRRPEVADRLIALLGENAMRTEAIRAMAAYEDDRFSRVLLNSYGKFDSADKLEAVQALASRAKSGWELTKAIKSGAVPKTDVPAYVARQLRRVVGNGFVEVWGPIDAVNADKEAAYKKYRELLSDANIAKAKSANGRAIFERTCVACHKLYDKGGAIGPELTGSNRANLDYILTNIIEPSAEIPEGYRMVMITTRDGRTYAGNVASESDRQLTLRVVGQDDPVALSKADIQSRDVAPVSMMPEGLLGTLTDQEVTDLVAYLRTTKQVDAE
ncbi:MAG: putative membrane-bound dehydrogenase-like protein [Verrucomicrobiales bacterium]|jgi:putative membrane-bound dehydrogenase-like protein